MRDDPPRLSCDPSQRYGECGRCDLPPARNIDLDAISKLNRATYTTSLFLIFLATVLGILAVGFWKTEHVHKAIVAERNV